MAQGEFLVALVSCDWTCSLHAGTVAIFVNRAAVLICLRIFESDRLAADGTEWRKRVGLHLEHLRALNSKSSAHPIQETLNFPHFAQSHSNSGFEGKTTCPQRLQTCASPLTGLPIAMKLPFSTQYGHRMMLPLPCVCSRGRYEFGTDIL